MNNTQEKKADAESANEVISDSKVLILIRHGQALHNISSDYWYTPDNPLTKDGKSQLKNVRLNLMKNHKKEFYESIEFVSALTLGTFFTFVSMAITTNCS